MNWFRWAALVVLVLIVLSVGMFTLATPQQEPHSASEEDVEERIRAGQDQFPELDMSNIEIEGTRVLVEADYVGQESISDQADWYQLAEDTANKLYHDVVRSRGVEVRIYQDSSLRGTAMAGI